MKGLLIIALLMFSLIAIAEEMTKDVQLKHQTVEAVFQKLQTNFDLPEGVWITKIKERNSLRIQGERADVEQVVLRIAKLDLPIEMLEIKMEVRDANGKLLSNPIIRTMSEMPANINVQSTEKSPAAKETLGMKATPKRKTKDAIELTFELTANSTPLKPPFLLPEFAQIVIAKGGSDAGKNKGKLYADVFDAKTKEKLYRQWLKDAQWTQLEGLKINVKTAVVKP